MQQASSALLTSGQVGPPRQSDSIAFATYVLQLLWQVWMHGSALGLDDAGQRLQFPSEQCATYLILRLSGRLHLERRVRPATCMLDCNITYQVLHPQACNSHVMKSTGAGVGAAWAWRGEPGRQLGSAAIASVQRFMGDGHGQVRAYGGARFDAQAAAAAEWEPFGNYYMLIPAVEMVRCRCAAHCLACVRWCSCMLRGVYAMQCACAQNNMYSVSSLLSAYVHQE